MGASEQYTDTFPPGPSSTLELRKMRFSIRAMLILLTLSGIVVGSWRYLEMRDLYRVSEAIASSQELGESQKEVFLNLLWQKKARQSGLLAEIGVLTNNPDPLFATLAYSVVSTELFADLNRTRRVIVCNAPFAFDHVIILTDEHWSLIEWQSNTGRIDSVERVAGSLRGMVSHRHKNQLIPVTYRIKSDRINAEAGVTTFPEL